MERLIPHDVDVRTLSPLTLAFVGDGVYELMVREMLACPGKPPQRRASQAFGRYGARRSPIGGGGRYYTSAE